MDRLKYEEVYLKAYKSGPEARHSMCSKNKQDISYTLDS